MRFLNKQISAKTIRMLKRFLFQNKEILFCYLFGSQTTQNIAPESDVDLAIYFDAGIVKNFSDRRLELTAEISKFLKREADITILNTVPPFLGYVILKEGKLIFERDQSKRIDFELKKLNEYFDFKPIIKKYNERLLNTDL